MLEKQHVIETKLQSHKVHHFQKLLKAHQHAGICLQSTYLSFRLLAMAFSSAISAFRMLVFAFRSTISVSTLLELPSNADEESN